MKIVTLSICVLLTGLFIGCASENSQANLKSRARISKPEALRVAQAKVPNGTVKDAELEEENKRLVWSFDFATPGTRDITEVQVDAVTGALVTVEVENPAQQAAEADAEAKQKRH